METFCSDRGRRLARWLVLGIVVVLLITICVVGIFLYSPKQDPQPESKAYQPSILGNFSKAAIAIDGEPCAKIGTDVLRDGGTAMDAAIAALFCNGVYNSQSMGIGGGFLMTYYDAKEGKAYTLDAREKAPLAATEDMFHGDPDASQLGALSVAVPGELAGYWEAKNRFGSKDFSWTRLIQPTIDMCRNGIEVSWTHANTLKDQEHLFKDPKLREVFINPETGEVWKEGDVYTRPDFADTLEKIAKAGDAGEERLGFYTGEIGQKLVEDLQELGGIITLQDLEQYQADWNENPVKVNLESAGVDVYTVPPPGSGAILNAILNILDNFDIKKGDDINLMHQRIAESFKWAYAVRTELGDPLDPEITDYVNQLVKNMTGEAWAADKKERIKDHTFNNASHYGAVFYTPDDHGTAHLSLLAENGDAVSVTSTINLYFGSKLMSKQTGIILNDEMDDFSAPNITNYFGVPPSPNNFIKAGKRPLSSMCPAIVVNTEDNKVRLVIGAAGGTKITTATALSIIHNLWLEDDIKTSIDERRIHHQLAPMTLFYEPDFSQSILTNMESRGHNVELVDKFGSVVTGVARQEGRLYANADFRKAGGVDGY